MEEQPIGSVGNGIQSGESSSAGGPPEPAPSSPHRGKTYAGAVAPETAGPTERQKSRLRRLDKEAKKNSVISKRVDDGHVEIYGLRIPHETPLIAVELLCYRTNRTKEEGGLGAEGHFRKAFKLMWPKYEWSEWVDHLVWAWCNHRWIIVIGHQRASKTYTLAHCALLDYCAEPFETLTSMATVTFEGLKLRMWSDLLKAVETAEGFPVSTQMQIRSSTNEMRIYPLQSSRDAAEKFQIHGMAVNQSKDAEGRIRGGHAPRRRIMLDEAQNIADPIFQAVVNPMSAPDSKCVMLTNPVEKISKFGEWCEPENGWGSVTDTDLMWKLKKFKDGICLHLDGLQSPNIKANRNAFTGLLTNQNVEEIRQAHGEDSVQWWSLVRGWFPPDGMVARVFPSSVIAKGEPSLIFDFKPEMCASLDPAFEHDNCVIHFGQLGKPVFGVNRYAINCLSSQTLKLVVSQGSEPKDYQIAHLVQNECRARGIKPEHFIMDGTGGGRGVVAILQKEWSLDIQVVMYGGAATDRQLRGDNPMKCSDMYRWFVSELWFRASEYVKDGLIGGINNLDSRTKEDLYSRRYQVAQGPKGSLQVVEVKSEIKKRLGRSPDHGDAFVQFGELLVRLGTFVGNPMGGALTASSRWQKSRERVVNLAKRHTESKEYSY